MNTRGCGHHGVGADLTRGDWKTSPGVILAIGATPVQWGNRDVMFQILGICHGGWRRRDHVLAPDLFHNGLSRRRYARDLGIRFGRKRLIKMAGVPAVKIAGGIVLILFATVLFLDGDPHQRQWRLHRCRMLIKKTAVGGFLYHSLIWMLVHQSGAFFRSSSISASISSVFCSTLS